MTSGGRLPDFLVIGAMKAGTTTLYRHLCSHPDVFMPRLKEPDFFVAEKNWRRGLDWYRGLFGGAGAAELVGEASTSYSKYPEFTGVPGRIHETVPEARIIYLLRDPVDRMVSMYNHMLIYRQEHQPIERALLENPIYLDSSRYGLQLRRFLAFFGREQIHVSFSDDLFDDPVRATSDIARFLGLAPEALAVESDFREYETDERRVFSRWRAVGRRLPLYAGLRDVLPPRVAARARRIGTRDLPGDRPGLSGVARQTLLEQLRTDLAELRGHVGELPAAWNLPADRITGD